MLDLNIWDSDVAGWSQAKIGYTDERRKAQAKLVADWSQAKIGYTREVD